jgi:hypothetical protein
MHQSQWRTHGKSLGVAHFFVTNDSGALSFLVLKLKKIIIIFDETI